MMNTIRRAGSLLCNVAMAALCLILLASCSTANHSKEFPAGAEVAYKGKTIPATSFDNLPPNVEIRDLHSFIWPFPLMSTYFSLATFDQLEDGKRELNVIRSNYNDLLGLVFFLPLRYSLTEYHYKTGEVNPTASRRLRWNPFWASSSSTNWPQERGTMKASGVPLFYARIHRTGPYDDTMFWHSIWSLGPMRLRTETSNNEGISDKPNTARGTFFMPLALGGPLGAILWTDLGFKMKTDDDYLNIQSHGPLLGLIGWFQVRSTNKLVDPALHGVSVDRSLFRMVLAGILWMDNSSASNDNPSANNAAHGPLWTCIGWGKRKGKTTVRILWIPITIPFQKDPGTGPAQTPADS